MKNSLYFNAKEIKSALDGFLFVFSDMQGQDQIPNLLSGKYDSSIEARCYNEIKTVSYNGECEAILNERQAEFINEWGNKT